MIKSLTQYTLGAMLFILPALAAAQTSAPAPNQKIKPVDSTCSVAGTIIKTEQWLNNPYDAPSAFSDIYTRLTIDVQAVKTFENYNDGQKDFCNQVNNSETITVKLCAPVRPQLGDVITAVVAPPVGTTQDGCLFDVNITDNIRAQPAE